MFSKFCNSKQDLKDAIEEIAQQGFAIRMKNSNEVTATAIKHEFVLEYSNADNEPVRIEFCNLWVRNFSSIMYIDGVGYSTDLLLHDFGGVMFSVV